MRSAATFPPRVPNVMPLPPKPYQSLMKRYIAQGALRKS